MIFVIIDTTENTGKPYISEDLSNTGTIEGAWQFDSEKSAQEVIDASNWKWASIEQIEI